MMGLSYEEQFYWLAPHLWTDEQIAEWCNRHPNRVWPMEVRRVADEEYGEAHPKKQVDKKP